MDAYLGGETIISFRVAFRLIDPELIADIVELAVQNRADRARAQTERIDRLVLAGIFGHIRLFTAKEITFFYEISTCDLYVVSAFTNKYLKPKDYLSLSFGIKLQLL